MNYDTTIKLHLWQSKRGDWVEQFKTGKEERRKTSSSLLRTYWDQRLGSTRLLCRKPKKKSLHPSTVSPYSCLGNLRKLDKKSCFLLNRSKKTHGDRSQTYTVSVWKFYKFKPDVKYIFDWRVKEEFRSVSNRPSDSGLSRLDVWYDSSYPKKKCTPFFSKDLVVIKSPFYLPSNITLPNTVRL